MTRIKWSHEEKLLVTASMIRIAREHPGLNNMELLRRGQIVLPRERHMVITHGKVYNHKPRIEEARKRAKQLGPLERTEPPVATNVPPPPPERPESTTAGLAALFEQLIDAIADRVAERVLQRIQPPDSDTIRVEVDRRSDIRYQKHNPLSLFDAKCKGKPGVLIIGLLPQQENEIRTRFGARLDLKFLSSEDARSASVVRRAHTILMTKFINHSVQDKYRKAPGLQWCNGATSELAQILDKVSQG